MGEIDLQCPFCGKCLKAICLEILFCNNKDCLYNELHKVGFNYEEIVSLSEYPLYIIDGIKKLYLTGKLEKTLNLLEGLQIENI